MTTYKLTSIHTHYGAASYETTGLADHPRAGIPKVVESLDQIDPDGIQKGLAQLIFRQDYELEKALIPAFELPTYSSPAYLSVSGNGVSIVWDEEEAS